MPLARVCVVIQFILDVRLVDAPTGVTQEEGHTGFLHLPSVVLALIFPREEINRLFPPSTAKSASTSEIFDANCVLYYVCTMYVQFTVSCHVTQENVMRVFRRNRYVQLFYRLNAE